MYTYIKGVPLFCFCAIEGGGGNNNKKTSKCHRKGVSVGTSSSLLGTFSIPFGHPWGASGRVLEKKLKTDFLGVPIWEPLPAVRHPLDECWFLFCAHDGLTSYLPTYRLTDWPTYRRTFFVFFAFFLPNLLSPRTDVYQPLTLTWKTN